MALSLVPLIVSSAVGFAILKGEVVAPMHDVARRNKVELQATSKLQLLMWDMLTPIDESIAQSKPVHLETYRGLRVRIEECFATLLRELADEPSVLAYVSRAQEGWFKVDRLATSIMSSPNLEPGQDAGSLTRGIHKQIGAIGRTLEAANKQLEKLVDKDRNTAERAYQRIMWLTALAAIFCLICIVASIILIGRVIGSSVDRLVDGASRFALGDRDHRIDIQVPPELSRVADEFNSMIGRIHETESALENLANADGLTELPNRRAFDRVFEEEDSRVSRHGGQYSVLVLDVDHFKRINDTHGHAAGDAVLREAARSLAKNLRPYDRIFRIGGEEFAVILPSSNIEEAISVAERLRMSIETTEIICNDQKIAVTISIGVAAAGSYRKKEEIMEAADMALYEAKAGGRNRVVAHRVKPNELRLLRA